MKFLLKGQLCFLLSFWQNPFKTGLHLIIRSLFLWVLFLNWSECYSQNCVCGQQAYFIRFKNPILYNWTVKGELCVQYTCSMCTEHRSSQGPVCGDIWVHGCLIQTFDPRLIWLLISGWRFILPQLSRLREAMLQATHGNATHTSWNQENSWSPSLKAAPRPFALHRRGMETQ